MNRIIVNILKNYINAGKEIEKMNNILFKKYKKLHNNFCALDFLIFCENYPTINDKIRKIVEIKNTFQNNFYIEVQKLSNKELLFLLAECKKNNDFETSEILDNYIKFYKI